MARWPRADFTADEMREALRACENDTKATAERLGCSRATVYNYISEYPDVRDEFMSDNDRRFYMNADRHEMVRVYLTTGKTLPVARIMGASKHTASRRLVSLGVDLCGWASGGVFVPCEDGGMVPYQLSALARERATARAKHYEIAIRDPGLVVLRAVVAEFDAPVEVPV